MISQPLTLANVVWYADVINRHPSWPCDLNGRHQTEHNSCLFFLQLCSTFASFFAIESSKQRLPRKRLLWLLLCVYVAGLVGLLKAIYQTIDLWSVSASDVTNSFEHQYQYGLCIDYVIASGRVLCGAANGDYRWWHGRGSFLYSRLLFWEVTLYVH